MKDEYKSSIFNVQVPLDDNRIALYNTKTGALALFNNAFALDKALCENHESVVSQGFIVNKDINELNQLLLEHKSYMCDTNPSHIHFAIAPTLRCQAKCPYCFEGDLKTKSTMSLETAKSVVNYIIEKLSQTGAKDLTLNLFGGEPLLVSQVLFNIGDDLKEYCSKNNIQMAARVVTNGILLSRKMMEELKERCNVTRVQITLDGLKETYAKIKGIDAFDTVVKNIKNIVDIANVVIRLNVTAQNKDELKSLVQYLLEEEKLSDKLQIYTAPVRDGLGCGVEKSSLISEQEFAEFEKEVLDIIAASSSHFNPWKVLPSVKKGVCAFENINNSCIGPEGELYKCERLFGRKDQIIGDVWRGSFFNNTELSFYSGISKQCLDKECRLLPVCFSGCPSERKDGCPSINCENYIQQFEYGLKHIVQLRLNNN